MGDALNCMPQGLVDRAGLKNCPTTHSLLTSLAIFNAEAALLSLIVGKLAPLKMTAAIG
jgi:hypothetical protein